MLHRTLAITALAAILGIAQTQPATQPADAPAAPPGMKWIPAGEFAMGSSDTFARPDESPVHRVKLDGFWIDETQVTNAQFNAFIDATKYITTAEKPPVLEEIMKQLPPGTPPPPKEALVAASMVFHKPAGQNEPWWAMIPGADWRHPEGPGSSIAGKDDHPVVQVSWDDAQAYAKWAGKKLPTEAQWEYAARGGAEGKRYPWGDEDPTDDAPRCNIWQGTFPVENTVKDGYETTCPAKAFGANAYGLFGMAGNVWQWTTDWYRPDTYATYARDAVTPNPPGPDKSFDPEQPFTPQHTIRGGSFLCHASYCSSYRVAARMKSSPDSATNHVGFRCVKQ